MLLASASTAWGMLIWQSVALGDGAMERGSLTVGMGPVIYIVVWMATMVAVMFPTVAQLILIYALSRYGWKAEGARAEQQQYGSDSDAQLEVLQRRHVQALPPQY